MQDPSVLLWAAGLLVLFVAITMAELWFLRELGFDVLAHLQVTMKQGKRLRLLFEAFGVVAFIMVQPVVLAWLFSRLSDDVARHLLFLTESITATIVG